MTNKDVDISDKQIVIAPDQVNFMASYHSRQAALRSTLNGASSSGFGGNNTFENSSVFDENNNDKIFIGSVLFKNNKKMHNAHRLPKKTGVSHGGHKI